MKKPDQRAPVGSRRLAAFVLRQLITGGARKQSSKSAQRCQGTRKG
jgi:hypothetical protein